MKQNMAPLFYQNVRPLVRLLLAHKVNRLFALIAFIAGAATAVSAEQTVVLGVEESRAFGMNALNSGRPDISFSIANTLLQRNPDDVQALIMLSSSQTAMRNGKQGAITGKRAHRLAKTRFEKYAAARAIASAKSQTENYMQAEFWLRRALQHAPDEKYERIVKQNFRQVRRRNPMRVNFIFGITPSTNINNGASTDRAWLFGLPFVLSGDAQALSGIQYTTGVRLRYRIKQNATRATDLGLMLYGTNYTLSQSAKNLAPDALGSDFARFSAEITARHRVLQNSGKIQMIYSAAIGQNWYGGKPFNRYLRFGVDRQQSLSPKVFAKYGITAEHQSRAQRDDLRLTTITTSGALSFRNKSGGTLTLGLEARKAFGSDVSAEYSSLRASVGYALGTPILGAKTTFTFSALDRDFPMSVFSSDGRQDKLYTAGISLLFSKADIFGFSPTINIGAAKTNSSIGLYDTETFTIKLGLRSTF